MDKVRKLLKENDYPDEFVDKIIENRTERFYNGRKENEAKKRFIPTPYIPGMSERLKKVLRPYDLSLGCKNENNIGNLYTRTKYKVPVKDKSKVIYRINCQNCVSKYTGQTKQKIKKRNGKHKSDVKHKKTTETTGLTIHAVTHNHQFDFEKTEILDHIPNYKQRIIAEKMHICKTKNAVNYKIDTEGLHGSYINLLKNKCSN